MKYDQRQNIYKIGVTSLHKHKHTKHETNHDNTKANKKMTRIAICRPFKNKGLNCLSKKCEMRGSTDRKD